MLKLSFTLCHLSIIISTVAWATQNENRSPNLPCLPPSTKLLQAPAETNPLLPVDSQILKVKGHVIRGEFDQFKNPHLKEIHLFRTRELIRSEFDSWVVADEIENPILPIYERSEIPTNKNLVGSIPLFITPEIFNLHIEALTVKCCTVQDKHIKKISEFENLKRLDLSDNLITDKTVPFICQLSQLTHLTLDSINITTEGLKKLLQLPNLIELDVSGCDALDEEAGSLILADQKIKKITANSSGIPHLLQCKIRKKYNPTVQSLVN